MATRRPAVKTDNNHLDVKVRLRVDHLPDTGDRPLRVLDAYHGTGAIWHQVAHRSGRRCDVLGIDQRDMGPRVLRGDNRKYLASLDLTRFDVIDLDAYGWPDEQLQLVADAGFNGVVFFTAIRTSMGAFPRRVLAAWGVTPDMRRQAPTIFNRAGDDHFEPWYAFLASLGYRRAIIERLLTGYSRGLYGVLPDPPA